jgi:hypothetical protein
VQAPQGWCAKNAPVCEIKAAVALDFCASMPAEVHSPPRGNKSQTISSNRFQLEGGNAVPIWIGPGGQLTINGGEVPTMTRSFPPSGRVLSSSVQRAVASKNSREASQSFCLAAGHLGWVPGVCGVCKAVGHLTYGQIRT